MREKTVIIRTWWLFTDILCELFTTCLAPGPTRSNHWSKYVFDAQLSGVLALSRERMKQLQVLALAFQS